MSDFDDFYQAYRNSKHFKPGDEVQILVTGTSGGCIAITLVVERDCYICRLEFYYDNDPSHDDFELAKNSPEDYLEMMGGATDWVEVMNNTDLEEC